MLFWFVALFGGILILSVLIGMLSKIRLKETAGVFQRFNEEKDITILTDYIKDKHSALRLANVLDFLHKIEDLELAAKVYLSLDFDAYPSRDGRVLALKALRATGHREALELGERLFKSHPKDPSVAEMYIDVLLTFEEWAKARTILDPVLATNPKGTVFYRQHAHLLAEDGKKDEAIAIMERITTKDFMLYKNTFAPDQKRLIYDQYVASQTFLNDLKEIENDENTVKS